MGGEQDGAAGSFINTAGFHADEAIFHDIDATDPVATAEQVEHAHDAVRGEQGLAFLLAGGFHVVKFGKDGVEVFVFQADGIALFEQDLDVFRLVGRFLGRNR